MFCIKEEFKKLYPDHIIVALEHMNKGDQMDYIANGNVYTLELVKIKEMEIG